MNVCENEAVIAFDTLYTQNHIQILKISLATTVITMTVSTATAPMLPYPMMKYSSSVITAPVATPWTAVTAAIAPASALFH
jgi:hypothetical protein